MFQLTLLIIFVSLINQCMGITERKERTKEDIKNKILSAARELFVTKGFTETSIRNIAEKIEYSPTTIYIYFKDKNDIFHAIHNEGFALLGDYMKVLFNVRDPFERLQAMGRVYVNFALENEELYELMFMLEKEGICSDSPDSVWEEGTKTFNILRDTVTECIDKGYFKGYTTDVLSFIFWAEVHGLSSLHIKGRSVKVFSKERAYGILMDSLESFIHFIEQIK